MDDLELDILLCQHLQNFYGFRCYWVIDHSWLGGKQLSYQGQFPKVPVTVTWTPEFQYSYPICKLNIYMLGLHFDQTKKQSLFLIRVILTCTWMISQWSSFFTFFSFSLFWKAFTGEIISVVWLSYAQNINRLHHINSPPPPFLFELFWQWICTHIYIQYWFN